MVIPNLNLGHRHFCVEVRFRFRTVDVGSENKNDLRCLCVRHRGVQGVLFIYIESTEVRDVHVLAHLRERLVDCMRISTMNISVYDDSMHRYYI